MRKSKFSFVLQQCRVKSGLSQKQVADALNIERTTYAYYETGVTRPSCEFVLKVSKILNVDYRIFMDAIAETKTISVNKDETEPMLVQIENIYNLSREEQNLVLAYRVLPPEQRSQISKIVTSA